MNARFCVLALCVVTCCTILGSSLAFSSPPELYSPQVSPDGSRTLWESLARSGSIWLTEKPGGEPIFITCGDSPSWIDDETFRFVSSKDDGHVVVDMDLWQYDLRSGLTAIVAHDSDNPDYVTVVASHNATGRGKKPLSGKTICVDPGHGKSTGAYCSYYGKSEDYYNMLCANELKRDLEADGARVKMTRTDNGNCPTLRARVNFSNANRAALFVSIHYNSTDDKSVRGIEVYYRYGNSTGKRQATVICSEMGAATSVPVRGPRADKTTLGFYLGALRGHNISRCCLTEGGYLSNAKDARLINRSGFAKAMAKAIHKGVLRTLTVKNGRRFSD